MKKCSKKTPKTFATASSAMMPLAFVDHSMSSPAMGMAQAQADEVEDFFRTADLDGNMDCSVKEPGLNELIDLQSANGTFKMGKSIETLLNMKEEEIKKNCPEGVDMDIWITALCIALIEIKFKESKDLWELVTSKARKSIGRVTENMDEILVKAEKYVKI